jgi:nitrate/TMAO reductase-like tetraheme cytochrome c subunit
MTAGCHDLKTLPRKEDSNKVDKALAYRYYKNAYHGQCIGCHKSMKMEIEKAAKTFASMGRPAPETGPIGCIECHPKD